MKIETIPYHHITKRGGKLNSTYDKLFVEFLEMDETQWMAFADMIEMRRAIGAIRTRLKAHKLNHIKIYQCVKGTECHAIKTIHDYEH